ncbi:NADPH oxidase 5 [Gryllus bimaculatus]|nr:NADPH oxidase 5 [Gryllus bimaculatus]
MRSERGKTYISSGLLLPSKVTHLVIKRPHHFDFHPGDYIFCSSNIENNDYMWLHIRGVGEWTNRLYSYFEREQEKLHNVEESLAVNLVTKSLVNGNNENPKGIKKIQASIKKKFENDSNGNNKVKAIAFRKGEGYINESFSGDSDINLNTPVQHSSESDLSLVASGGLNNGPQRKLTPDRKLQMLIMNKKSPLSKSLSMPDMQTRVKKRERLLV